MKSALHTLAAVWPWTTVDMLNHLWQSTVVGVAVLLVLAASRGLSARTRCALGWMALVKFALPASLFMHAFARLGATPGHWAESGALPGPIMLPAFVVTTSADGVTAPMSVGALVTCVWLAGFSGLLVTWIVRGVNLRRRILAEMEPVPAALAKRVAAAAARGGWRGSLRCAMVADDQGPGVLGVISPMVILPRGLEATLAPDELESVLIHEFVHLRRRDTLWSALQAFFVSLFWFHPVVWLLNRRLSIETEQSCDERVLEITGDPDTYAGGIVKAVRHALGMPQPGLVGAAMPPVVTRIKNIFAHGTRRDRPLVGGAVLAGGVLLLGLSGYTGSFAAQSPTAATVETRTGGAMPAVAAAPAPKAPAVEPTLSVDFPNEEIRQIISNVANLFELKVVMPDALQGKTTIKLNNVTWRQIFQGVLEPVGYTFVEEGDVVRIVARETLGAEPVTTEVFRFTNARAEDMLRSIIPLIDPAHGQAVVDSRTNSLVITERASRMNRIRPVIGQLDRAPDAPLNARSDPAGFATIVAQLDRAPDAFLVPHPAALPASESTRPVTQPPQASAATSYLVKTGTGTLTLSGFNSDTDVAATISNGRLTLMDTGGGTILGGALSPTRFVRAEPKTFAATPQPRPESSPTPAALTKEVMAIPAEAPKPASVAATSDAGNIEPPRPEEPTASDPRLRGIRVYDPSQLDQQPVPKSQVRPQFPLALRRSGVSGEATVDFIVDTNGEVQNAYAIHSTYREFGLSAVAAVSQWKFRPGRKGGGVVNTHMQVPIVFALNNQ